MDEGTRPRYRFAGFALSPSRRVLLREGREIPLIPRYFDLLVMLVARRGEALTRREILDTVWHDVVVSDGALSQAVRTLRRGLDDDPRNPAYIRTVQRHGYRFVFEDVAEEADDLPLETEQGMAAEAPPDANAFDVALDLLLAEPAGEAGEDARREAAARLHELGVAQALQRLGRRPGHTRARALLRDARWDLPSSEPVPLLGAPGGIRALAVLFRLRLGRAVRLAGARWAAAVVGGAAAGCLAGFAGGAVLRYGPGSTATHAVLVALPVVGLVIGGLAAAGIGAGLCAAEALVRSVRPVALVVFGALGGGTVGVVAHTLGRWTLEGLFGGDLSPTAGGVEGVLLGAAAGAGYALATPVRDGGMAAPRGARRLAVAAATGLACALAAAALAAAGSFLGAMSLDLMARSFPDSQVGLDPLARLLGEETPGRLTRVAVSAWEGGMLGLGLALGMTRRPTGSAQRGQVSHSHIP